VRAVLPLVPGAPVPGAPVPVAGAAPGAEVAAGAGAAEAVPT
jgi:hypothetical protein